MYNTLANYMRDVLFPAGYVEVKAPLVLSEQLWHTSGHYDNYLENMFFTKLKLRDPAELDGLFVAPRLLELLDVLHRLELRGFPELDGENGDHDGREGRDEEGVAPPDGGQQHRRGSGRQSRSGARRAGRCAPAAGVPRRPR